MGIFSSAMPVPVRLNSAVCSVGMVEHIAVHSASVTAEFSAQKVNFIAREMQLAAKLIEVIAFRSISSSTKFPSRTGTALVPPP